jgi:hypothetical protein
MDGLTNSSAITEERTRAFPPRGWIGLLLVAIFWPLNWILPGLRTAYLFFPLWLGYILIIDTLVEQRTGSSLWIRSRKNFIGLFFLSAPAWWLFEWMNKRLGNWQYLGGEHFSDFEYFVLSSISFSTVMPAVFETAELVRTWRWIERRAQGLRVANSKQTHTALFLIGIAMLTLMLIWPKYFYPFAWGSIVFLLEPINYCLGHPHFLQELERGDWRKIISLALGALICGFFWEMWNFYSYPKWIYHTPGAQFLHIFEMPLLGYIGYIPFALELCALKNLVWPNGLRLRL